MAWEELEPLARLKLTFGRVCTAIPPLVVLTNCSWTFGASVRGFCIKYCLPPRDDVVPDALLAVVIDPDFCIVALGWAVFNIVVVVDVLPVLLELLGLLLYVAAKRKVCPGPWPTDVMLGINRSDVVAVEFAVVAVAAGLRTMDPPGATEVATRTDTVASVVADETIDPVVILVVLAEVRSFCNNPPVATPVAVLLMIDICG